MGASLGFVLVATDLKAKELKNKNKKKYKI